MRPEFFAVQLVRAAISLAGVACLAALPLPDYRWYNRLAVVLLMGFATFLLVVANLWMPRLPDQLGFVVGSIGLGIPLVVILFVSLHTLTVVYPEVVEARLLVRWVKLMPSGMMVQLLLLCLESWGHASGKALVVPSPSF